MTGVRDSGVRVIDAGENAGSFERLRAGAVGAVDARCDRILVDLRMVDPVDGAMLAVLARMSLELGSERLVAVVASEETLQFLAEWRLDSQWLLFSEPDAAIEGLFR